MLKGSFQNSQVLSGAQTASTNSSPVQVGNYNGFIAYLNVTAVTNNTPTNPAVTTATTGGTLAAATYYYKVTAIVSGGAESGASVEVSVTTTGTTSSDTVTWTAVSGATGYRIYRGTTAGGENTFYSVGTVTTFTDTGAAGTAGTPPTATAASIAIKLQDSVDAITWYDIPSGAFTSVSAPGTQRLVIPNAGDYMRAVSTVTGSTPSIATNLQIAGIN